MRLYCAPSALPGESISLMAKGKSENSQTFQGLILRLQQFWAERGCVIAQPYDTPVLGYGVNTVNLLRLWSARSSESFDFDIFMTLVFNLWSSCTVIRIIVIFCWIYVFVAI